MLPYYRFFVQTAVAGPSDAFLYVVDRKDLERLLYGETTHTV